MTTSTAAPDATQATVAAEYGEQWKLYSTGAIQRGGDLVASFDTATATLLWETKALSKQYRLPVSRLINAAKWKAEKVSAKDYVATVEIRDAPPRPPMHPDYGEYTPSLVRWRHKFAPEEFELIYGVISTKDEDRRELPNKRKDVYPDYRRTFKEAQPEDKIIEWRKPGGAIEKLMFERHAQVEAVPAHLWRCYGEEIVGTERKYPALCETVLTYIAAGASDDLSQSRTADPNIQY